MRTPHLFAVPSVTVGAAAMTLIGATLLIVPASATPDAPITPAGNCNATPYPAAPTLTKVWANPKPTRGKVKVKWKYRGLNQGPESCMAVFWITSSQGLDSGPLGPPDTGNVSGQCSVDVPCVSQNEGRLYYVFKNQPKGATTFTVTMWWQNENSEPGDEPQGASSSKTSKSKKVK